VQYVERNEYIRCDNEVLSTQREGVTWQSLLQNRARWHAEHRSNCSAL